MELANNGTRDEEHNVKSKRALIANFTSLALALDNGGGNSSFDGSSLMSYLMSFDEATLGRFYRSMLFKAGSGTLVS